ncbi:hypothetical protein [Raineyella fluvialis]|uniref:Uncharacterized protein n=1 Tax=Raineyella fluvialis TaxID=2662261 RepID=A0A5Q2FBJ0_9ACTN|nr:hypothetical protein [Raineyella fluvialis]QGF24159.1 hypothetical protein Rai3103_11275 [Raineyella fluvialis]
MIPWLLVGLAVVVLGLSVPVARGAFGEMPQPPGDRRRTPPAAVVDDTPADDLTDPDLPDAG